MPVTLNDEINTQLAKRVWIYRNKIKSSKKFHCVYSKAVVLCKNAEKKSDFVNNGLNTASISPLKWQKTTVWPSLEGRDELFVWNEAPSGDRTPTLQRDDDAITRSAHLKPVQLFVTTFPPSWEIG